MSQGFVIPSFLTYSLSHTSSLWSKVQECLPKNIFNFTIKYLNNTLTSRKNLHKWSLSQSPSCSFCLQSETLQHIVSSCKSYFDHGRYNWRHNSVLLCLSKSLSYLPDWSTYADLPSFPSPSLISGDTFRPDFILHNKHTNAIYILELLLLLLLLLLQMLKDLNFNKNLTHHIMKASNIAIRCTYYIYCRRNKQWSNPDLLQY